MVRSLIGIYFTAMICAAIAVDQAELIMLLIPMAAFFWAWAEDTI